MPTNIKNKNKNIPKNRQAENCILYNFTTYIIVEKKIQNCT